MKLLIVCTLVLVGDVAGQVGNEAELQQELISKLMALQNSNRDAAQQVDELTSQLMAVTEAGHRPSRAAVATFAGVLTKSLAGRVLPRASASLVAKDIIVVFRSAGMGTFEYRQSISRVEKTLSGVGVNGTAAQKVAAKLMAVGDEARGPQDIPLLSPR